MFPDLIEFFYILLVLTQLYIKFITCSLILSQKSNKYSLKKKQKFRVPTVMENPGKSWKKVVMESYGKVMENSKNLEFSHGKVMEISCPNPPNRVPIVL